MTAIARTGHGPPAAAALCLRKAATDGAGMARDAELEAAVRADLGTLSPLVETAMFGGLAWLWRGNLLCAAGRDGLLLRVGQEAVAQAAKADGVAAMVMGTRPMRGWVRLDRAGSADAARRGALLALAQRFVATLPAK